MAQTLARITLHVVFSTKDRQPLIHAQIAPRLYAYIGTVAHSEGAVLLAAGGMPDHVHLLLALRPAVAPADLVRTIKANSSRWVKETFEELREFSWQGGYGAFSVSTSGIDEAKRYIGAQAEHHHSASFQEEFRRILHLNGLEWDEGYVWS